MRSIRTSHRYEFRVLLHCTKAPLPDQSLPFSPKEEGSSGPGGGQQYKSKHFAGEPYSSYLWLLHVLHLAEAHPCRLLTTPCEINLKTAARFRLISQGADGELSVHETNAGARKEKNV